MRLQRQLCTNRGNDLVTMQRLEGKPLLVAPTLQFDVTDRVHLFRHMISRNKRSGSTSYVHGMSQKKYPNVKGDALPAHEQGTEEFVRLR